MFSWIDNGKYIIAINKKFINFFFWITRMIFSWYWNILKVIFKLNSLSINKKNHINIKCSLLNKTLHFFKTEIFSIKLWRKLTKLYLRNIISSDHKNAIQFFINHLPCPWIWKMIRRNKLFNPPVTAVQYVVPCSVFTAQFI